jgi:hypothetical protein
MTKGYFNVGVMHPFITVGIGVMGQVVEHLPCKLKDLRSNPSIHQKKLIN